MMSEEYVVVMELQMVLVIVLETLKTVPVNVVALQKTVRIGKIIPVLMNLLLQ